MNRGSFVLAAAVAVAVLTTTTTSARADLVNIKFGGAISSDIRFRLAGAEITPSGVRAPYPSQYRLLPYGFSRNENIVKAQLTMTVANKVKAVADVDFYWYGYSDLNDIDMTTLRERVDPFRVDSYAAYVEVYNILPKLDLRVGRQVVAWGVADKFNPTNNLNSLDLSDPLLFGRALGNQMIRLDWNPWRDLVLTAVWVPIFRPAQLPRTAPVALTQPDRPAWVQEDGIRDLLYGFAQIYPPEKVNVFPLVPEPTIQNSQFGARLSGRIKSVDVSLSYYYGRFGVPVPAWTENKKDGTVDVGLVYPRMQVIGADIAGSIEKLRGLGYWIEAGLFIPQEITYGIYDERVYPSRTPLTFRDDGSGGYTLATGYPEAKRPTIVPSTPFLKLTAGWDLTINKYLYCNMQYVYGFIDEFGWGKQPRPGANPGDRPRVESRLGHYLVAGLDLKLFQDALLLRFFGAFKVPQHDDPDPKFTAVLFPQISWTVWDGTELTLASFVFLGDRSTKFGDPASGATELVLKAKFSY
jgi:hypothetical protein